MTPAQRRVTLALCLSVGLTFMISAGLTFLVTPMAEDFELSSGDISTMLAIPSIASLAIIFVAGQIGDRLGHRRVLIWFSGVFVLGSTITAFATSGIHVTIGLALCGSSATAIQIIALSLLQKTVPDGQAHVSAFTTYGMVYPFAYLIFPLLTAGIVDITLWRVVPAIWIAAGVAMIVVISMLLDSHEDRTPLGEWITPVLAGLALAAFVRTLDAIGEHGLLATETVQYLVVLVPTLLIFAVRYRTARTKEFSFEPLRSQLLSVLLIGVALVALVGTLTFVTLSFQYLYAMSPMQSALAVVPAQACGIFGAKVIASRAIHRWGRVRAGRHLTVMLAVSMLPLLAMHSNTPAWYLMACAALFTTTALAAVTILNTDVMFRAPEGNPGPISSFRGAASSIGSSLAVVVLGTGVLSAVNMSGGPADVTPAQLEQLAHALRIDGILGFLVAFIAWSALYVIETRARDSHEAIHSV